MALAAILTLGLQFLSVFSVTVVNLTVEEENVIGTLIGNIAIQARLNISTIPVGTSNIFSILTSPNSDFFTVTSNGDFFAVKKINRETICQRLLICIIAIEVAVTQSTNLTVMKVNVTVTDINDNYPVFSSRACNFSIPEGTAIKSYELPSATDSDVGLNSIQSFILEPEGTSFGLEARRNLDESWALILVLNLTLDREIWNSYNLVLKAIDGGKPSLIGMLTISLTVLDINDNRPVFSKAEYNTTIDEDIANLTEIVTVNATDRDAGENGRVSYYFAGIEPNSFANSVGIEEDTGKLYVEGRLNSQKGTLIVIFVEARDHGDPVKRSNQCKVTINVRDKNDNAPEIQITVLGNVTENAKTGTPVALIQITDTDTGLNGEAVCACDNENFIINNFTKNNFRLDVGSVIDREVISKYFIVINCSDKGEPPLSSKKSFDLWVQDENDNVPQFSQSCYTYSVQENNAVSAIFLRVIATDKDVDKNSKIIYHLEPFQYSSSFLIDEDTGIIKANKTFDYEEKSSYEFNVTATDTGQLPLSNWTRVTIHLTDLNDNSPKFSRESYAMSVMENAHISKNVGQVTATDKDSGYNGKLSYMIPAEYRSMPFKVLDDGAVVTTETIDRELNSAFQFAIVASDHGDTSLTTTVIVFVTIIDQNDNKPVFEFPNDDNNTVSVPDNIGPNVAMTTVIAHDADDSNNSLLTYTIIDGNADGLFQIEPVSGEIYLSRIKPFDNIQHFVLNLSARDHGDIALETLTTLIVKFYVAKDATNVAKEAVSKSQNIVIAIVISCLTFVFSLVIIAVICVIWRKDKIKSPFIPNEYYDEQKIIERLRNSNQSISSKSSRDKMLSIKETLYIETGYQNRGKKNFRLSGDESHDTGVSMETDGPYEITSTCISSSIPTQSSQVSPSESQTIEIDDKRQRELHRMTSLRVQQVLTNILSYSNSNNNNNKQWLQSAQEEMAKTHAGLTKKDNLPLDDSHSDLSGETFTSDSGRGGSEEDIHCNVINSHDSADLRSSSTLFTHPFYTSESKNASFSSLNWDSAKKTRPKPFLYLNQNNYRCNKRDPVNPLNDLSNSHRNNIYHQQRRASERKLSAQMLYIKSRPDFEESITLEPNFDPLIQQSERFHLNIKSRLIYENVNLHNESVTVQSDDETTTTSGSYTVTESHDDVLDVKTRFYTTDTFV